MCVYLILYSSEKYKWRFYVLQILYIHIVIDFSLQQRHLITLQKRLPLLKSWFSTCHFQLLSLRCGLTAVAFVKMTEEYNLHCNLFKQFSAMISTFVVGEWLEIEVVRKLTIPLQNYEQNQLWRYKIYPANTFMHFVTWTNNLFFFCLINEFQTLL